MLAAPELLSLRLRSILLAVRGLEIVLARVHASANVLASILRARKHQGLGQPIALLLLVLSLASVSMAAEKSVLFIHTDKSNGPAVIPYDKTFQAELSADSKEKINLYNEYTDLWRLSGDEYARTLHDFYKQKYAGQHFDVIIVESLPALRFLLAYGDELFPGVPVVFSIMDRRLLEGLSLKPNFTGVLARLDFKTSLESAFRLQPDTRRVVVVGGTSPLDQSYLATARGEFQQFEGRLEFTYLTDLPIEEIERRVSTLPEHTIVFYVSLYRDSAGHVFPPVEAAARIGKAANAPFYSIVEAFVTSAGGVGGYLWSVEAEATEAAKLSRRILEGAKPQDIPIYVGDTNRYIFDWRQLRRWGISESRLPPGSILRNKELSFWEQYKWRIVAVALLCILQALFIVWLLINRNRRRRAEEAKDILAAIVESSDDAILSKTLDGTITSWNAGAEKMYGYSASEMVGRDVSTLAPDDLKEEVPEILEHIRRGESVDHLETVRMTKEGRRTNISLTISPIKDEHGKIIGASTIARDITDRKQGEQALQQLTGRLLMSQDEERKRVAAELHDGLGQSLAIIKNRAMIGMRDQSDQDRAMEQLAEISATAASAILEVREITQNLRPYELDRLGLVAAIESMIERVSASTSIKISADLERIEGLLSPEAETSVYRIVQEGLNNVIKHSNATTVRIEIKRIGNKLAISVQDNGVGIIRPEPDDNGNKSRGFGLAGIAERVRVLGGSLVIDSDPARGTTLTIRLESQSVTAE